MSGSMRGCRANVVGRSNLLSRRYPTSAYTLLELMIVLVVVVTIAAVAWPRITGQMQLVGPRESALQVSADLARAREEAIRSGVPWGLRILKGTGVYEMGPVDQFRAREDSLSTQGSLGTSAVQVGPSVTTQTEQPVVAGSRGLPFVWQTIESLELLPGMVFDDGFAHASRDANLVRGAVGAAATVQPVIATPEDRDLAVNAIPGGTDESMESIPGHVTRDWKYVVIFQPDGRATESELRLKEQGSGSTIRLRIRGFTGGVTIDPVERRRTNLVADGTTLDDQMMSGAQDNARGLGQLEADVALDSAANPSTRSGR